MKTILVVDDEIAIREFVTDTMQYAGYTTISAPDGDSGIRLAREHIPDLIISDLHMPNVDGFAMLETIRKSPATNTIPIIFLTAENDQRVMRSGMFSGAEDFLVKPVTSSDLLTAVTTQLEKRIVLEHKYESTLRLLRRSITYALPHELRTPLHLISGYAELLKMDNGSHSPQDVQEFAASISEASARLERLCENYLVYAQAELILADPAELQAARNHLVKDTAPIIETASMKAALAHRRVADLQLDLCAQAMRISEDNLAKIIFELADNAFKFSEADSVIDIQSRRMDDTLQITIRDEGHGMSQEEIKQAGAYMQFGRELYEQQGVGLGFAVAKRLVEIHGGIITIDSRPKRGTTVCISFALF